jgi:hypothetical protein
MKKPQEVFRRSGALLLVLGLAGCSSARVYSTDSRPRLKEIRVDGKTDDWLGSLSIIEDGNASVGFLNDRENLYICLLLEEELLEAQAMRQGLTVWFDPKGGKEKWLGIRYPLGRTLGEKSERPQGEPGLPPSEGFPEEAMSALEILRSPKGEPQKMEIADVRGIEITAVPSRGLFVYELKIPLSQTESNLIALEAQPGQTVGIGFEIPKLDRGQMPGRPSEGMPGGGGRPPMGGVPGAGGGGRPGGMRGGGPGGGMMEQMPEGLKIWALVRLSSGRDDQPTVLLSASTGEAAMR